MTRLRLVVALRSSSAVRGEWAQAGTVLLADAATTVVQVVLIGGVVILIALLMWWGLRRRARMARVMRTTLYAAGDTAQRPPGSAVEIADAGQVPVHELLGALRVRDSDDLAGLDVEEFADALGLKYFAGGGTRPLSGGAT